MFTDKEINAYRDIKAPSDLCKKIKNAQKKSKRLLYSITVVAACFVFMITGVFINSQSNNIVVNGQKLKSSVEFYDTTSSLGRTVSSVISVPVEIKVSRSTNISVEEGLISIDGGNSTKEIDISDDTMFWWEVEPSGENQVFEMLITDKKGVQKITLEYKNAKITVTKEKEK